MTPESQADMLDRLRAEHPGWTITANPAGLALWTAERRSADGRSIHYIVCQNREELSERLAAL